ncbi:ABC transporter ATP-binding protein [Jatrophihabitans endophyticus]|uniref:ABC transporter ATP-binding protein n=1 Tax=Jatrophihabitans endophyticus TaxID=1206085 RepID=UPI00190EF8C1|nr:ABC transporter ATP-binding protein [Jatrophihabitans endophyticus]
MGERGDEKTDALIEIEDLHVQFALRTNAFSRLIGGSAGTVNAVDGVNLRLGRGEVVGLVGESGSGKSTLGRALLGLVHPTSGSIRYDGRELVGLPESRLRPLRRRLQMVFQDPHASMNPSMTVGGGISDALRIHGLHPEDRREAVGAALERVGLAPASRFIDKYPSELSGGQKQRAVIARAIALGPELLVADEPISMLDMSVRAKILGLMSELRRDLGLTYLYITHDLASARFFCDRVAIMYLGKIVEIGSTAEIFDNPRHPYTKALLRAVPDPDPSRSVPRELPRGEIPDAAAAPLGCAFHPRCPQAFAPCGWEARDLRMILEQRWTSVPAEQYESESRLVRDGTRFASPDSATSAVVHSSTPPELLEVLTSERTAHPDDPLWTGVHDLTADSAGVRVRLAEPVAPQLRPVPDSDASVSCHLFHDPAELPAEPDAVVLKKG